MEGKDKLLDGNYPNRENPIGKCAEVARRKGMEFLIWIRYYQWRNVGDSHV